MSVRVRPDALLALEVTYSDDGSGAAPAGLTAAETDHQVVITLKAWVSRGNQRGGTPSPRPQS